MNILSAGLAANRHAAGFSLAARIAAACVSGGAVLCSHASGPQFTFAGRIVSATPPLPPPWDAVAPGQDWEMTVCLDYTVPDVCALPDRACVPAGFHVQFRIGGVDRTITGPGSALITVINAGLPRGDGLIVSFRLPDGIQCTLNLRDESGTAFSSIGLPECGTIPDPAFWTSAVLTFDPPGPSVANGRLTRIVCTPRLPCGPCPDCPADYNQDGGIDGTDVGAFFADWEAGLACSDVNRDGGIDNGDVTRFFRLWENGICCFGSPDYNGDGDLNCNDLCEFYSDHRLGRGCADINADGAIDAGDISQFLSDYTRAGGTGCAGSGDFNLDGAVNCADVCLFGRAFAAGDFAADVNCDGQVDLDDLLAFQRAYALAGGPACPRDGDFNLDGSVDCGDVCDFSHALMSGNLRADYNCDGISDDQDLALFIDAYQSQGGPVCPRDGDFNLDRQVNCADQCAFQRAFATGDSRADYNCDGAIDAADVLAFREAYEASGGPECPHGADFNLDGRIDCRDLAGFEAAVSNSDPAADLNCDGLIDSADVRRFHIEFLDLNRDGALNCRDLCVQIERVNAQRPAADMNCDGSIDAADLLLYQSLFNTYYSGPVCGPCP